MATAALFRVMHEDGPRTLHPFFNKPSEALDSEHHSNGTTTNAGPNQHANLEEHSQKLGDTEAEPTNPSIVVQFGGSTEQPPNSRKKKAAFSSDGKKQKSLRDIFQSSGASTPAPAPASSDDVIQEQTNDVIVGSETEQVQDHAAHHDQATQSILDDSSQRSKRRRTSEHGSLEVGRTRSTSPLRSISALATSSPVKGHASPQVIIPALPVLPHDSATSTSFASTPEPVLPKTPPKKMLRLNGTGRFSSPIAKKTSHEEINATGPVDVPRRRGRPRKVKEQEAQKHLLLSLRYGTNAEKRAELGQKIEAILKGELRTGPLQPSPPNRRQRTPRKPPKYTHPFFVKEKPTAPKPPSPKKLSATTPGKLRTQTMHEDYDFEDAPFVSALSRDRLMMRHPGAKDALWPTREESHVRGIQYRSQPDDAALGWDRAWSKSKRKAVKTPVPRDESILSLFQAPQLSEKAGALRADGYSNPHPSLRVPSRLLLSGEEIAARIRPSLAAPVAEAEWDQLALSNSSQITCHPALVSLFKGLPTSLSAFDQCKGASQGWAIKYAPHTASEVLQPAGQTRILRDWLATLTVKSVESGHKLDSGTSRKSDQTLTKKRRRRKGDGLDDFLVDDDEVIHEMDEVEDTVEGSPHAERQVKSVVQAAGVGTRLSNAILLSGPHGCGKTAAAYAVASELGFRVFDISPCERRSGKDVLSKVGDMTENHLVKHHGTDAELSAAEESTRHDEAFQRDLQSGRQGKMIAFFEPNQQTHPKLTKVKPTQTVRAKTKDAIERALKRPSKDQQQSLILLEEVDILFKDDKEFWGTILKLILSSKRPFIMTCNQEDLVPLQAMNLFAILRFIPPVTDLAVDYMLLVAATEGHLLQREAVTKLYRTKKQDLRASISELDFWCQMGVGDPKAGLSWLFQRWPPGSDKDVKGRTLRVVSDGTYQTTMGLASGTGLDEAETLHWAWHQFAVDSTHFIDHYRLLAGDRWSESIKDASKFADTMSSLDLCCAVAARTFETDTTQKPMSDKSRSQYIEGLQLLQTDELMDFRDTTCELRSAMSLLAMRSYTQRPTFDLRQDLSCILSDSSMDRKRSLSRHDFACLDPISWTPDSALGSTTGMQITSLDGPLDPIAVDIAPYVRNIVQYDLALEEQRNMLHGVDGSRSTKRARTTRAARSALEGSQRASTRRERWFSKELELKAVLATGHAEWPRFAAAVLDGDASYPGDTPASSASSVI